MARLGDAVLHIGADLTDLNSKLGQAKKGVNRTLGNIKKMGAGLSATVTAPIVAIGASSFKTAAEFEQSMAKVQAVSGATGAQFKALEQDALRLGSSTSFTASEVSGLQLEFAKLGFTSDEITKVTESTLNLAKASGSDLATSAEVAGATLRGFGLEADETSRVTDVMASSFSTSALDMSTFKDAMKFVAPVAKAAGVSLEDTTAMLGSLANAGIKGSQAGTALRRIISDLGATGGDVSAALKDLSNTELTLADAKDEVGRSAQSALLVLTKSTEQTAELGDAYRNSAGSAKDMAGTMDNTSQGALARMNSAIEGAQIAFGKVLAPVIEKVAKFVENLANKFSNLSERQKKVIAIIGGVAAAIGPLLVIIPSLVSVASVAGPALGAAFTMMTGPIGIAIAAIAGLTAAFFYFWDEIKVPITKAINALIDFWNQQTEIHIGIELLKQAFVQTFTVAQQYIQASIDIMKTLFFAIKTATTEGFSAGFEVLKEGVIGIKDDIVATGHEVYDGWVDAFNRGKTKKPVEFITTDDLDRGMDRIKSMFDFDLFGGGGGGGGTALDAVTDSAKEMVKPLEQASQSVGELDKSLKVSTLTIAEGIKPMRKLQEEFVAVMDLSDGVTGAFVGIGEAIAGMVTGAVTKTEILGKAIEGLGNFLKKMGSAMVMQAVAMLEFQKSLIINPVKAIAMGTAFVVGGALLASYGQQLGEGVALAKGGLAFGETLATVGDNPGARFDPEVIAPLSKLEKMMGGGAVQVHGRISGNDILLSNARAERDRNRTF